MEKSFCTFHNEMSNTCFIADNLPYEKLLKNGVSNLTDADLLAVILRTGAKGQNVIDVSYDILNHPLVKRYGLSGLYMLSLQDFKKIKGIGEIKASQLVAVCELTKRIKGNFQKNKFIAKNPKVISDYYMEELRTLDRERVLAVFLDSKRAKICDKVISIGTLDSSVLNPREIFKDALSVNASSFVVLHNHPSGDPTPSLDDKTVTKRIKSSSELLGIPILDHIIIGDNRYFSFRESGLL